MTAQSILMQPGWMSQTILSDILISGLLIVFIQLLSPIYIHFKKLRKLRNSVPSPKSHWLFGHLVELPATQDGMYKRVELVKKFPSMFCFNFGPFFSMINIYHPDNVKTFLTTTTIKGFAYRRLMQQPFGEGLVTSNGAKWQRHRRLLTPTFHFEILKSYVKVFNENMPILLDWLDNKASTKEKGDISKEFGNLTFNNMTQCIMSQSATEGGKVVPYINAINVTAKMILQRLYNPFLWSNFIFYLTPFGRRYKEYCKTIHDAVRKIIKDRKEALETMENNSSEEVTSLDNDGTEIVFRKKKGKRIDFLDVLLQTKDEDGNGLDEQSLVDEVATFFAAGQETTSNAMSWTCYLFTLHQDWQDKCRQEVLDVCGVDGDIEWDDISKLSSMSLCIKESLRLYPIAPMVGRETVAPMTLKDNEGRSIIIDKGTTVVANFFALHRHPDFWDNPETFDPERFTPERSKNRPSFAYLPFSGSYRNCIGQNFALNQMKVTIAQVLRKYRLWRKSDFTPVIIQPGITLQTKHGLVIRVEKV